MLKSVRDKWVEALRSGEYKQCTGTLRKDHDGEFSYCCLGVLANEIDSSKWNDYNWYKFEKEERTGGIGVKEAKEMGLQTRLGESYDEMLIEDYLIHLNDGKGYTFEQIADVIEQIVPVEEDPLAEKMPPVIDREYLESILDSFKNDPADTDYQAGYLAAIAELYHNIGGSIVERYGSTDNLKD